ncbi:hypothetical protein EV421DRAFT_1906628 [Armillaria borealis]|uniref:Uncharacterized protein n=1 Tax=Armillaria borealis TaxID=47425 RepID=A0AA39J915_9AGAR|nr:hypothetical protein EV421DRAFT_1906628 [Armillaria borealis]
MSTTDTNEKRKPRNSTWAIGSRTPFFESQEGNWRAHVRVRKAGEFYDYITLRYQVKYEGIAADVDLENPTPDMPTAEQIKAWKAARKEEEKDLSPDQLAEKQALDTSLYKNLRTRIASWFNWRFNGGLNHAAKDLLMCTLTFFTSRISSKTVDAEYAQSAVKSERIRFSITKMKIKEHWEREREDVKMMVHNRVETDFQEAMSKYKKLTTGPKDKTAEDYHLALTQGSNYVQVIANTLRDRFGLQVSVLLAGPIGANGGTVEVRSIHSGTTLTGLTWPQFDPVGFHALEKSMMHFGLKSFSEEERSARALKGTRVGDEDIDDTSEIASSAEHVPDCKLSSAVFTKQAPAHGNNFGTPQKTSAGHGKQDVADNAENGNKSRVSKAENDHQSGIAINSDDPNQPPTKSTNPHDDPIDVQLNLSTHRADSSMLHTQASAPTSNISVPSPAGASINKDDTSIDTDHASIDIDDTSIDIDDASIGTDGRCDSSGSDRVSPLCPLATDIAAEQPAQGDPKSSVEEQEIETGLSDDDDNALALATAEDKQGFWDAANPNKWYPELHAAFEGFRCGADVLSNGE